MILDILKLEILLEKTIQVIPGTVYTINGFLQVINGTIFRSNAATTLVIAIEYET